MCKQTNKQTFNQKSQFHTCKKCKPEKCSPSCEVIPPLSESQGHSSSSSSSSSSSNSSSSSTNSSIQGASMSSCDNEKYPEGNKNIHFSSFHSNKIFKNEKM